MSSVAHQQQRRVEITAHAMHRLIERVGSFGDYQDWQQYVRAARYKGRTEHMLNEDERAWIKQNMYDLGVSAQVRFFDGYAFLFRGNCGKARTLITVIPVPNLKEEHEMTGPFDHYGIVHDGDKNYYLTEEPAEIDRGVYEAEAVDAFGNKVNVELEGWGDGDFDFDAPLDVW